MSSKITPFLWFDNNAQEAMQFYKSVFKDVKIGDSSDRPEGVPGPVGEFMVGNITILGQEFTFLNGGPMFKFNESVSFMIHTNDQQETDYYWKALTADGGEESMCGWLKDKYGLSWQVTPTRLLELMNDKDPEKSKRVMDAMMQMRKIEIDKLEKAYVA
jgi:predicted 3-demethylubiquinone-9 3-methyltransferase (glyoxalase superfamily)